MEPDSGPRGGTGRSGTNARRLAGRVSTWGTRSLSLLLVGAAAIGSAGVSCAHDGESLGPPDQTINAGKQIFRFETFGDETFWTDTLGMHFVVQTLPPTTALAVGLKVDADTLPAALLQAIQAGQVDLANPATTVTLLKLGAVVGLRARVDTNNQITSLGITCALCHSTVDNRIATGIGSRLDGWPNLELDPGAIIALSPVVTTAQKAIYNSWGPGRFDPRFNLDGLNGPVLIPPAYGLKGVHSITVTGDGPDVAYWNRYVGVTQMHGHGSFVEPRLGVNIQNPPDLISSKLAALQAYQLSLTAPPPPAGSVDTAAATRGRAVFDGAGQCSSCHAGTLFTDANTRLHAPAEVVSEPEPNGAPSWASRSATKMYRTTPLRGLQLHPPYFHNGIAPTLDSVVALYDAKAALQLTPQQKADLVQFLKSR